jgi:hypothetical protein
MARSRLTRRPCDVTHASSLARSQRDPRSDSRHGPGVWEDRAVRLKADCYPSRKTVSGSLSVGREGYPPRPPGGVRATSSLMGRRSVYPSGCTLIMH